MRIAAAVAAAGIVVSAACAVSAGGTGLAVRDLTADGVGSIPATQLTAADVGSVPAPRVAAATAWCGSSAQADRVPNLVAGNPIHWVYAIPSDGADGLTTLGPIMQADADQIDGWWRREDPTRAPRNDLASFSCGPQLDITTLRMARTSAELAPLGPRFAAIADALEDNDLDSTFTKYLVYFDGPTDDANVCGQGGSDPSGFGLAVVYVRSCVGVSTAAVAAHEFLHTGGAVSRAAPNDCEGERSGHTCDDERDLMFPAIGGEPLSEKLLDPGRNDYYGHAGGWSDAQDSAWLVRLDAQVPFSVAISGPGSVSANVPGLLCAASCTTTWNGGQPLTLTATPSAGARLLRWSGACSGAAACALAVNPGASVSAQFAPATFRLAVAVGGRGVVRSARAGITCRPRCSAAFRSFTPVRLTATPARGWKLRSWSGACRGARLTCTVPMSAATSTRATFVRQQ